MSGIKMNVISFFPWGGGKELAGFCNNLHYAVLLPPDDISCQGILQSDHSDRKSAPNGPRDTTAESSDKRWSQQCENGAHC